MQKHRYLQWCRQFCHCLLTPWAFFDRGRTYHKEFRDIALDSPSGSSRWLAKGFGARWPRTGPFLSELLVSCSISVVYKKTTGEMSERLKEHDWKSCERAKTRSEGSNPSLSAIIAQDARPCATLRLQTPSGSEESSGSDYRVCRR